MRSATIKTFILTGLLIVSLILLALVLIAAWHLENPAAAAPPDTDDPFELGQYYFNHSSTVDRVYDLKKARHYYEQALTASSTANPLAWYQLGRIDFIEGRFDAALYKFDKQLEYFGDRIPNVYYMIGLTNGFKARRTGRPEDWQKGAAGFITYLEHDPGSPWARTDLAWIYFSEGKFEEMKPVLEEGFAYHPDHPWLNNMYGLALLNTGEIEAALAHFELAAEKASELTVDDWGRAYPGNDPAVWERGLREFQTLIAKNRELASTRLQGE